MSLILKEQLNMIIQAFNKLLSRKADRQELQEEISKVSENIVQPDWNQNNETAADYVKNRTHWKEFAAQVLWDENITITDAYYENTQFYYQHNKNLPIDTDATYDVAFLGETFSGLTPKQSGVLTFTLSNGAGIAIYKNNIQSTPGDGLTRPFTTDIKVVRHGQVTHQLDGSYIPPHTHNASAELTGAVPIDRGGTGCTTQVAAMAALGQGYANCFTIAATANKKAELSRFSKLMSGAIVGVMFNNANTAASPTLNISETGAKPIYNFKTNAAVTTNDMGACLHLFMYNGSQWVLLNPLT